MATEDDDGFARFRVPNARRLIHGRRHHAPAGLNATQGTESEWPLSTVTVLPVSASQMRAVLSADAVTTRRPLGLKAALALSARSSQIRAVLSLHVVTTRRPSGLNSALSTEASCPLRVMIILPIWTSIGGYALVRYVSKKARLRQQRLVTSLYRISCGGIRAAGFDYRLLLLL